MGVERVFMERDALREEVKDLRAENARLTQIETILKTRVLNQQGDDVCWLDVYVELSEFCGVHFDPKLIDREQFVERNCPHFYDCLAAGKPYKTKEDERGR